MVLGLVSFHLGFSEKKLTAAANEAAGSATAAGFLGVWLQACVDVAGQY